MAMTAKERRARAEERRAKTKQEEEDRDRFRTIIIFAIIGLIDLLLIWASVLLAANAFSSWGNFGNWFGYILGPVIYCFAAYSVYRFFKHLVTAKTYFKLGVAVGALLFLFIGVVKFCLPERPVSMPMEAILFDANGDSTKAVCPICKRTYSVKQGFCEHDGHGLIKGRRENFKEAGIDLDGSPLQRLMHKPGERPPLSLAPVMAGITLPVKLEPGQTMEIRASGKIFDLETGESSGPAGIDPPAWHRDGRIYSCGGKWLALCAKVNPGPWVYCGNKRGLFEYGCELTNPGPEPAWVVLLVNEATADQNRRSHLEWWEDDSGGYNIVKY